ncbi:hypothetical protein EJ110_NYTH60084 [Nymphaea thermarum]|nr:hypothetical protein EJ110_NYTH60084 [Nymphaea thermarum]
MEDSGPSRENLTWTENQMDYLVQLLVEQSHIPGMKSGGGLKPKAYTTIEKLMIERFGVEFTKDKIKNKLKYTKPNLTVMKEMLNTSGFGYDPINKCIQVDAQVWNDYIQRYPSRKKYRGPKVWRYYDEFAEPSVSRFGRNKGTTCSRNGNIMLGKGFDLLPLESRLTACNLKTQQRVFPYLRRPLPRKVFHKQPVLSSLSLQLPSRPLDRQHHTERTKKERQTNKQCGDREEPQRGISKTKADAYLHVEVTHLKSSKPVLNSVGQSTGSGDKTWLGFMKSNISISQPLNKLTARAGGSPASTSPSPPVLLHGPTSAVTNTIVIPNLHSIAPSVLTTSCLKPALSEWLDIALVPLVLTPSCLNPVLAAWLEIALVHASESAILEDLNPLYDLSW